jgi:hypothetical protein
VTGAGGAALPFEHRDAATELAEHLCRDERKRQGNHHGLGAEYERGAGEDRHIHREKPLSDPDSEVAVREPGEHVRAPGRAAPTEYQPHPEAVHEAAVTDDEEPVVRRRYEQRRAWWHEAAVMPSFAAAGAAANLAPGR